MPECWIKERSGSCIFLITSTSALKFSTVRRVWFIEFYFWLLNNCWHIVLAQDVVHRNWWDGLLIIASNVGIMRWGEKRKERKEEEEKGKKGEEGKKEEFKNTWLKNLKKRKKAPARRGPGQSPGENFKMRFLRVLTTVRAIQTSKSSSAHSLLLVHQFSEDFVIFLSLSCTTFDSWSESSCWKFSVFSQKFGKSCIFWVTFFSVFHR